MKKAKVAVIGSYAVGVTIVCKDFPTAGQTVFGHDFSMMHGGKGSNQAVAAQRLGANVVFGTCIGKDSFGDMCMSLYKEEGMDSSFIRKTDSGVATAVGLVIVNEDSENEIIMDYGAAEEFSPEDIDNMFDKIKDCSIVLTQLEMSADIALYLARKCHEAGITFVLNPAPYKKLPEEIFAYCDYVTPNQTEARQMLDLASDDPISDKEVAQRLCQMGVTNVIMTLGEGGALHVTKDTLEIISGITVKAVDTTGAGDTFSGALCVALAEEKPLEDAIRFANAAAGLAVTKYGVVEALPYRNEVEEALK